MEVDKGTDKVLRLYSAKALPLERCKADRSLPLPLPPP